mgnify:CR=1 FL=1
MFLPGMTNEVDTFLGTLGDELDSLRRSAADLTDEQARTRTTRSELTVGGIVKHVTFGLRGLQGRLAAAPDAPSADLDMDARIAEWSASFALTEDETLADVLTAYDSARADLFDTLGRCDMSDPSYYPPQPWFGIDATQISMRWAVAHTLVEVAHHAGHADIIREELDGATTESLAGITWEPEG